MIDLCLAGGQSTGRKWRLSLGNWNEKRFDGFVSVSATLSSGPCGNDAEILKSNISVAPLSLR